MNSTLLRAGRATHLKIVLVSLIAAVAVVAVGFNANTRITETTGTAVVKAKPAAAYAGKGTTQAR